MILRDKVQGCYTIYGLLWNAGFSKERERVIRYALKLSKEFNMRLDLMLKFLQNRGNFPILQNSYKAIQKHFPLISISPFFLHNYIVSKTPTCS
jgi:hypothetical protein